MLNFLLFFHPSIVTSVVSASESASPHKSVCSEAGDFLNDKFYLRKNLQPMRYPLKTPATDATFAPVDDTLNVTAAVEATLNDENDEVLDEEEENRRRLSRTMEAFLDDKTYLATNFGKPQENQPMTSINSELKNKSKAPVVSSISTALTDFENPFTVSVRPKERPPPSAWVTSAEATKSSTRDASEGKASDSVGGRGKQPRVSGIFSDLETPFEWKRHKRRAQTIGDFLSSQNFSAPAPPVASTGMTPLLFPQKISIKIDDETPMFLPPSAHKSVV